MYKSTNLFLLIALALTFSLQSCKKKKKADEPILEIEQNNLTNTEETIDPMTIQNEEFYGIETGDIIEDLAGKLERGTLKSGKEESEVYFIKDESGEQLGYVVPSPQDESSVGNVVITSPAAKTQDGVSVGMTFKELEQTLGVMDVHGSEVDGKTTTTKDNITYVLDSNNYSYDIDKTKLASITKIKEIYINRIYK